MDTIIMTSLYKEIIDYLNNYIPEPIADNEDDFTAQRECAYRLYDSLDDLENDNEKVRRYLTDHFRYLMKNVLYLDMNKYNSLPMGGSFYNYIRTKFKNSGIFGNIRLDFCLSTLYNNGIK